MALSLTPVPASRGPRWVVQAFRLFARRPLAFTGLFGLFLIASVLVGQVPLLGSLLPMMSLPLLSLGFMVAGQSALQGGPVNASQFVAPLLVDAARRRALLVLCALYGVIALVILLLADTLSNHAMLRLQGLLVQGESAQAEIYALLSEPGVGGGVLLGTVLGSLMAVPFWHAAALVHWGGQGVRQSLFSSTLAVWRSKGAFFTYTVAWMAVMLLFGMLAVLVFSLIGVPQLTGVLALPAGLVFTAVFYLSVLFTFNDSFVDPAATVSSTPSASSASPPPAP